MMATPNWHGDEEGQRAFVLEHYGRAGLDAFIRGQTAGLNEFEYAMRGKHQPIDDEKVY
jgi:hypothetical protein